MVVKLIQVPAKMSVRVGLLYALAACSNESIGHKWTLRERKCNAKNTSSLSSHPRDSCRTSTPASQVVFFLFYLVGDLSLNLYTMPLGGQSSIITVSLAFHLEVGHSHWLIKRLHRYTPPHHPIKAEWILQLKGAQRLGCRLLVG